MRRSLSLLFAVVVAVLAASTALALPPVGEALPALKLVDADDVETAISASGKPIVVFYEEKAAAQQNQALKDDLARVAPAEKYKEKVVFVAIADVVGYDYWPARGFVKSAVKKEQQKAGTPIYLDWDGGVRAKLKIAVGQSNVIVYGRDGKALFSKAGPLTPSERQMVLDILKASTSAPPPPPPSAGH